MFLFNLLNSFIDSSELLSMIEFRTPTHCLKKLISYKSHFIKITIIPHKFSLRLKFANLTANHNNFFLLCDFFKQNIYLASNILII